MTNYYFDMDGVLANFHKEPYSYANAISYNFLANLEPFMTNVNLAKELMANGNEVFICSLAASENAKKGKLAWLAKYLPEIKAENIIIIVGNAKKSAYIKTENGTLIDDKKANCKEWEKAGYKAVWVEIKGELAKIA